MTDDLQVEIGDVGTGAAAAYGIVGQIGQRLVKSGEPAGDLVCCRRGRDRLGLVQRGVHDHRVPFEPRHGEGRLHLIEQAAQELGDHHLAVSECFAVT